MAIRKWDEAADINLQYQYLVEGDEITIGVTIENELPQTQEYRFYVYTWDETILDKEPDLFWKNISANSSGFIEITSKFDPSWDVNTVAPQFKVRLFEQSRGEVGEAHITFEPGEIGPPDPQTLTDLIISDLKAAIDWLGTLPSTVRDALLSLFTLTSSAKAAIETYGRNKWNEFVQQYPEYQILSTAPAASPAIFIVLGIIGGILGFGTLVNWLRKELPEPVGMAVWAAIEAEDWETADAANQQYRNFIDKSNSLLIEALSWLNPFVKTYFDQVAAAQHAQADAFQEIIDAELAVKTGTLIINPTPTDSKVSVSGQFPITGTFEKLLEIGTYTVTVSKFGYISQSGNLEVTENMTTIWNPTLQAEAAPEPLKGIIKVESSPTGASVEIPGQPTKTTPAEYTLDAGTYDIQVFLDGYIAELRKVFLDEGETEVISVTLNPTEVAQGRITINSNPQGARIYIDGVYKFTVTPFTIEEPAGSHIVRLELEGYVTQEQSLLWEDGVDRTETITLTEIPIPEPPTEPPPEPPPEELPEAEIEVPLEKKYNAWKYTIKAVDARTSEPLHADITIDGIPTENFTPWFFYFEPLATYNLKLSKWGYKDAEVTINTAPLS